MLVINWCRTALENNFSEHCSSSLLFSKHSKQYSNRQQFPRTGKSEIANFLQTISHRYLQSSIFEHYTFFERHKRSSSNLEQEWKHYTFTSTIFGLENYIEWYRSIKSSTDEQNRSSCGEDTYNNICGVKKSITGEKTF